MTKVTQISTAVLLTVFASTAFTTTAEARASKQHCEKTIFSIFKTACEQPRIRARLRIPPKYTPPQRPVPPPEVLYNFRSRSNDELSLRSANGGGTNGSGAGGPGSGGRGGGAGAGAAGGAAGGNP